MAYQSLDPSVLAALDSYDLPDPTPLKQAGFTSLDIRRGCRALEQQLFEQLGHGLPIDQYDERIRRWRRNRDYICKCLERQGTALLQGGTGCCGRIRGLIRAILAGILWQRNE